MSHCFIVVFLGNIHFLHYTYEICEGKPTRMRRLCRMRRLWRFGHNLLIQGLRAYALTLPLLGFKCTWYKINSRDMNEKGKDFIFYNKPYMHSAGLHGPLHMAMVCALCPCSLLPAPTPVLDLHAHTQWHCLLLLGQKGGGVHVLKCILLISFRMID